MIRSDSRGRWVVGFFSLSVWIWFVVFRRILGNLEEGFRIRRDEVLGWFLGLV